MCNNLFLFERKDLVSIKFRDCFCCWKDEKVRKTKEKKERDKDKYVRSDRC